MMSEYVYFVSYLHREGTTFGVAQSVITKEKPVSNHNDIQELTEDFKDFHASDECVIINYKLMNINGEMVGDNNV